MTDKLTFDDLRAMTDPLQGYVGYKIKHLKSNSFYLVTGIHFVEDTMQICFSYQTLHTKNPVSFVRPIAELLDGRFQL